MCTASLTNINFNEHMKNLSLFQNSRQIKSELKDCENEIIYSVSNDQCNRICKHNNFYLSQNGICVNSIMVNSHVEENECNPERGVLAYLLGNSEIGTAKLFCISSDLGIQSNDLSKKNIICDGGEIDINYHKEFPLLRNCKCKNDEFLSIIAATDIIRRHGICIKNEMKPLYELNQLIYKNV